MSPHRWLIASVTANAALLALWLGALHHRSDAIASPVHNPPPPASLSAPAVHPSDATPPSGPLTWAESMAQLRRVGIPGPMIARLVVEKVAQKWTPLETQLEQQYLNNEIDAKRLAEFHDQRAAEEESELRAALGDGFIAWDRERIVQSMYLGGLQPTEAQKEPLYALQKNWLKQLHDLELAQRHGQLDPAAFDQARSEAESDYKVQLAAIIGRDRVDGLDPAAEEAARIRRDFKQLQLSDEQISTLASVHKKWSDIRSTMAASLAETKTIDGAYEGDLQALDRARDDEYRRVLGEKTFDTWQRSVDDRYRVLRANANYWALNEAQISHVYSTLHAYELAVAVFEHQAQTRSQSGQSVDWGAVDESLTLYTQQTEQSLRAYLGNERFERMQKQHLLGLRQTASGGNAPPSKSARG